MAHFTIHNTTPPRDFQILSFSWRGSGHRAREEQKQDYCDYRDLGPFGIVAVVSDGVGSCPRSREGAESVVQTALDTLEEALLSGINILEAPANHWKAWIGTSIERNRKKLAKLLAEPDSEFSSERKIRELFSATQLLAWTDGRSLVTSIVGDGAIIGVSHDDSGNLNFVNLVDVEKHGMANEVVPVTIPSWERGWLFRGPDNCTAFEGVILATDGFSDSAGEAFWRYLWESLISAQPKSPNKEERQINTATISEPETIEPATTPAAPPRLPASHSKDPREEFLQAFAKELELRGYSSDDKTIIVVRFL
jgi:hypothetical protein